MVPARCAQELQRVRSHRRFVNRKLPEECDCGQFAAMLLKPSEIQYEKVATNMARFKRGLGSMMKKSIERVKRLRRRGGNGQNNRTPDTQTKIDAPEEPLALDKWTFKFGERINPIIVCVNSKSGGHKGDEILHSFYRYLNPLQVVDLVNEGIESINKFRDLPRWRLVIAGGDGTVSWVLNYVYGAMKPRYYPEVGLVPLGTGNDLSRVLGWGKTIGDTEMQDYLKTFDSKTTLTLLDRWKLTFTYKRPTKVWSGLKRQAAVRTTSEVVYTRERGNCVEIHVQLLRTGDRREDHEGLPHFARPVSLALHQSGILSFLRALLAY